MKTTIFRKSNDYQKIGPQATLTHFLISMENHEFPIKVSCLENTNDDSSTW